VVVLVGMGNAEIEIHLIEERGLGQLHAARLEVARHIEAQAVGSHAQAGMVEQRGVGASVLVQHQTLE